MLLSIITKRNMQNQLKCMSMKSIQAYVSVQLNFHIDFGGATYIVPCICLIDKSNDLQRHVASLVYENGVSQNTC